MDRGDTDDYGIAPPGYRLPPQTRPGRVRLQVADLDRSVEWYRRVLGMRAREAGDDVVALTTHDADAAAALIELVERPGARRVAPQSRLGLYHYAILLPDRASLGQFVSHLGGTGEAAGASDHLVSEALYLHDPDGLGIEVYADRPRASWRHEDRQIRMSTEPLDVQGVAATANGQPWTGMPAGALIGHVHLHVGDIDRARAFYHEALGLDLTVWSYPGALFLSAGGYHHHLGVNTWAQSARPAADGDARLLDWELVTPSAGDADAALASLEAAGHDVDRSNGLARDPWGTALRIRA